MKTDQDFITRCTGYSILMSAYRKPECRICKSPLRGTEREYKAAGACLDCYEHHLPKLITVPKRRTL